MAKAGFSSRIASLLATTLLAAGIASSAIAAPKEGGRINVVVQPEPPG